MLNVVFTWFMLSSPLLPVISGVTLLDLLGFTREAFLLEPSPFTVDALFPGVFAGIFVSLALLFDEF